MRDYIELRAIEVGKYIIDSKATVRKTATKFGVSKSTVHKDLTERLPQIDHHLADEVRDILDINNGERFHTYVIKGKADSGMICLNGAAARKVQPGDKVIIIAYGLYNPEEMENYKPTIIIVDDKNKIINKQ